MGNFVEDLKEGLGSTLAFLKDTKGAYEGSNRFAKLRIWVLGLLGLDVILTLLYVAFAGGQVFDVEVWYQKSFPSNLLIVRHNGGRALKDLTLTLDGQYSNWVDRLEPGLKGFELRGDFHDATGLAPGDQYRPRQIQLKSPEGEMTIPVLDRPES